MRKLSIKELYKKIQNTSGFTTWGGCPPSQIIKRSCDDCPLSFYSGRHSNCYFIKENNNRQTSSKEAYLKFLIKKFPNLILD